MYEIKELYIYDRERFSKFLNHSVVIKKKLNAINLTMNVSVNGKLTFYKRDTRYPLNIIDRTISHVYETPILHLESIVLPESMRGMTYHFKYKHTENELILTHLSYDTGADVLYTENKYSKLRMYAKALQVSHEEVIFDGILANEIQMEILDMMEGGPSVPLIENVIIESPIAGAVKSQVNIPHKRQSIPETDLLVLDFANWLLGTHKHEEFCGMGYNFQERYLDIITKLITEYISESKAFIEGLNIKKQAFALSKDFRLNTKFIESRYIKEFIHEHEQYDDIYQILIGSFRRERSITATNDIIAKEDVVRINIAVSTIVEQIYRRGEQLSYIEWKKYKNK